MYAITDQKSLKSAVTLAATVANHKTLPVLRQVRITALEDSITVEATNLTTAVSVTLEATAEPGVMLCEAKSLKGIIDTMSPGTVTLSDNNCGCGVVEQDSAELQVGSLPVDEYPNLPTAGIVLTEVAADLLVPALARAVTMASPDDSRPQLNGVLLRFAPGRLTVASSDGYRLYQQIIDLPVVEGEQAYTGDLIVPRESVLVLGKVFKGHKGAVLVKGDKMGAGGKATFASFQSGAASVTTVLVEGNFPSFDMIIPKEHTSVVSLPVKETLLALDRLKAAAPEKDRAGITRLFANGTVKLSANTEYSGGYYNNKPVGMEVEVNVAGGALTDGPENWIAFNATYLRDALKATGDVATLYLQDESKPAVFRSEAVDNMIVVLMPMHVGSR